MLYYTGVTVSLMKLNIINNYKVQSNQHFIISQLELGERFRMLCILLGLVKILSAFIDYVPCMAAKTSYVFCGNYLVLVYLSKYTGICKYR